MILASGLLLPLGARNALLQAAGFAPAFPVSPLDSKALGPFRAILNEMIDKHSPNPALLVDRYWTVREANTAARTLVAALQAETDEVNLVRLLTSGDHAAKLIGNFPEVLNEMRARLQLEALEAGGDPAFADLLAALDAACARHVYKQDNHVRRPVLPLVFNAPEGSLRFLSAIAHFGTSEDVTIRDLRLELLFPADETTRRAIQAWT